MNDLVHPVFVGNWSDRVTETGWHAWKYEETPENEPLGVMWVDVKKNGTYEYIEYYLAGHLKRTAFRSTLRGIMVCKVLISLDNKPNK